MARKFCRHLCSEIYPNLKNVENYDWIVSAPLHELWPLPHPFSWNSHLFNGILCKSCMQFYIGQEVRQLWVAVRLCFWMKCGSEWQHNLLLKMSRKWNTIYRQWGTDLLSKKPLAVQPTDIRKSPYLDTAALCLWDSPPCAEPESGLTNSRHCFMLEPDESNPQYYLLL
jgi:hypothetical protein